MPPFSKILVLNVKGKKMKKLVFAFAAFAAISFAACGNKAANNATANDADITVVETVDSTATACCDSTAACCDSTKVAE